MDGGLAGMTVVDYCDLSYGVKGYVSPTPIQDRNKMVGEEEEEEGACLWILWDYQSKQLSYDRRQL